METSNRGDRESRHGLADVMAELSEFRTITTPSLVLDMEIDQSLRAIFGRPTDVRRVPIFGYGAAHASGDPELRFRLPAVPDMSESQRAPPLRSNFVPQSNWRFFAGPMSPTGSRQPISCGRTAVHMRPGRRRDGNLVSRKATAGGTIYTVS